MTTWNKLHVQLHNQSCPTLRRASQTRYPAWRKILISRFFNIHLFWGGLELWRDFSTEVNENASKYFSRWNYLWVKHFHCLFPSVKSFCWSWSWLPISVFFALETHVPISWNIILFKLNVWKGVDLIWIWIYLRTLMPWTIAKYSGRLRKS